MIGTNKLPLVKIFCSVIMTNTRLKKVVLICLIFLHTSTVHADGDLIPLEGILLYFFSIALAVFLFIMGAVHYFSPPHNNELEVENAPIKVEFNSEAGDQSSHTQNERESRFVYVFKRSFLIFVILIVIILFIGLIN